MLILSSHKSNCRIGESNEYLHVMWSSPNNFDKHASHLAVGVSQVIAQFGKEQEVLQLIGSENQSINTV